MLLEREMVKMNCKKNNFFSKILDALAQFWQTTFVRVPAVLVECAIEIIRRNVQAKSDTAPQITIAISIVLAFVLVAISLETVRVVTAITVVVTTVIVRYDVDAVVAQIFQSRCYLMCAQ